MVRVRIDRFAKCALTEEWRWAVYLDHFPGKFLSIIHWGTSEWCIIVREASIGSESTPPYLCPEAGGITLKSTTISVPHQVVHSRSEVIWIMLLFCGLKSISATYTYNSMLEMLNTFSNTLWIRCKVLSCSTPDTDLWQIPGSKEIFSLHRIKFGCNVSQIRSK